MKQLKSEIKDTVAYHRTIEDTPVTFEYAKSLVCKSPMLYNSLALLISSIDKPPNDTCTLYDVGEEEDRCIVDLPQDPSFRMGIFDFLYSILFLPLTRTVPIHLLMFNCG